MSSSAERQLENPKKTLQELKELQAFDFCVVTVDDKDTRLKERKIGIIKFKIGICAELCLKLWFDSGWYFCNVTDSE